MSLPQLRLGILAIYLSDNRLEERSYFRKLCIQGNRLGIESVVFTPDDVDEAKNMVHAQYYDTSSRGWKRKWVPLPRIVYDRCRYHGIQTYRKLTQFRNRHKFHYLSRPLGNKWRLHQILSENDKVRPHLPQTQRYKEPKDLRRILKDHRVVFMKPINGTGGRGIVRVESLDGKTFMIQGRDYYRRILSPRRVTERQIPKVIAGWPQKDRYLVQQGIPLTLKDGRVHDFRMLVQRNGGGDWEITGCAGRIGPSKSVTSNLHGGGSAVPMEKLLKSRFTNLQKVEKIKSEAYQLGIDTVEHLEKHFGTFCEAGIDLAVDPSGHVWLLEVNPKPSREVFYKIGEQSTYRKAIARPLEFALWLSKQNKSAKRDSEKEKAQ
ncbi:YheC/YheD family protein [Paenibacillus thalictri]|uniref:YheC/YheD family protein n=1 Tax=Paenibacillus thalictri TaxID=2527873 RepID=A0A4Q9DMW5_9BACL|nr:YheC/YheD family protein [Paenibacillus thalictri]TBL75080.1 YheC/YheD family protein [Paenibacillus thalictri]